MPAHADETCTVRLPKGAKAQLMAATGQPFSRLLRFIVLELLAKYKAEGKLIENPKSELRADVASVVSEAELPNGE